MSYLKTLVSVADLNARLNEPGLCIVDCRHSLLDPEAGRALYEAGHLPGAVHADMDRDLAGPVTATTGRHPLPAIDEFIESLRRWGIGSTSQVVVYDDAGGGLAARLWWMLNWLGHEHVAVLDGGIAAWERAGLPVSTEAARPERGDFAGVAGARVAVTTDDVSNRVVAADELLLIDARDPARFRGEQEPIDPVAGHVPGAVNLPFSVSLNDDGTWKSATELAEIWSDLLENTPAEKPLAVMCGSGVTACHLALSATIAGIREPALYVGSWSEWIRDSGRPVAADSV